VQGRVVSYSGIIRVFCVYNHSVSSYTDIMPEVMDVPFE